MKDLTGRVTVVTGGSSGIGVAGAEQLAERGAEVVLVGRTSRRLGRVRGGAHLLWDASADAVGVSRTLDR